VSAPLGVRLDRVVVALAALTGTTAWISMGTLAVTNDRVARLGAVPPVWMLGALVFAFVALALALRLRRAAAWPLLSTLVLWLPSLPVAVTPAFLIWDGPLETMVWMTAFAGVAAASLDASAIGRRVSAVTVERGALAVGALALATSLAAGIMLARAQRIPGGDEPHYLIITQSLLSDGDLRIQNNHDRGDYFAYFQNGMPPDFLQRGQDGQIYSVHAPGLSILLVPVFAIGGYAGSVVAVSLISAAAVAMGWSAAFLLTGSAAASWAASLATFFSGTVFFHSFAIFPDPIGAAITAAVLLMLVRCQVTPMAVTRRHVAVAGLLLGMLPWLHTRFAVISAAAALVIVGRLWRRPDRVASLAAFAVGPALLAVAWFGYFVAVYGTPDPSAPYGNSQQNALAWIGTGITGLLVDQQFGVLPGAPVLALVPVGLFVLARIAKRLAAELLVIAVPYALVVASFGMWWGGWSAPARFLVCLMPLAVPALALAWRGPSRTIRAAYVAAVLIGVANIVARLTVLDGALLYNNRDGFDLLLDWLSRHVNIPLAMPSVHRSGPSTAWLMTLGWGAMIAMALAILSLLADRVRTRGAQWAATGLVVSVTLTLGMAAIWQLTGAAALTPTSSQAEFVRRWDAERRPIAIQLPSGRTLDPATATSQLELRSSARARDVSGERPLLAIPWVPAGDYRVVIEGASELAGTLTLSVGRTSQPIELWSLASLRPGVTPLQVRLPAQAHSIVIRADEHARARITRVALRPERLQGATPGSSEYILRAGRYGTATAYFLDDEVYMEPAGLWTRGNGTGRFFLVPDAAGAAVTVDVQAGPVATAVEWTAADRSTPIELNANERRRVQFPAGLVTLRTTGAFRPVDHDPGAEDRRRLGVRLEFPGPSGTTQ
jgi:hypothetical protein